VYNQREIRSGPGPFLSLIASSESLDSFIP